ncbi:MAG: hypothetical protein K2M89_02285 [Clostridiales bacterium]|nr:hypothetical protein [Clostridiales bacterium]
MKYAVIDLSSTGVSIVVAEGDKATGIFTAVYKDRANIAVADYFEGHSISRRGIEKLIDALITARSTVKAMGVDECYCISTAALRNIDNIEEVAEKIRMRTGIVINYLDGVTEAYCDFLSNRKYMAYEKVILIDIGGGSVELCDFKKERKDEMVCLDFGPIKLRNKYAVDIYPTDEQAKSIKKYVRKKSDEVGLAGKNEFTTAVLVGSINDAIYAAYSEYCEKERFSTEFDYTKYKQFCKWLLTSSDRTRLIMKVAPEKIHVLPVASIVLKEMLKRFKPNSVMISDCGVKEGYLSLVALGEEKGVPIDLNESIPTYMPEPPQPKRKKKSNGKKSN